MRSAAFVAAALLAACPSLTACSSPPDQPGGITADEAQQLNDAAAMLDANAMDAPGNGAPAPGNGAPAPAN